VNRAIGRRGHKINPWLTVVVQYTGAAPSPARQPPQEQRHSQHQVRRTCHIAVVIIINSNYCRRGGVRVLHLDHRYALIVISRSSPDRRPCCIRHSSQREEYCQVSPCSAGPHDKGAPTRVARALMTSAAATAVASDVAA